MTLETLPGFLVACHACEAIFHEDATRERPANGSGIGGKAMRRCPQCGVRDRIRRTPPPSVRLSESTVSSLSAAYRAAETAAEPAASKVVFVLPEDIEVYGGE